MVAGNSSNGSHWRGRGRNGRGRGRAFQGPPPVQLRRGLSGNEVRIHASPPNGQTVELGNGVEGQNGNATSLQNGHGPALQNGSGPRHVFPPTPTDNGPRPVIPTTPNGNAPQNGNAPRALLSANMIGSGHSQEISPGNSNAAAVGNGSWRGPRSWNVQGQVASSSNGFSNALPSLGGLPHLGQWRYGRLNSPRAITGLCGNHHSAYGLGQRPPAARRFMNTDSAANGEMNLHPGGNGPPHGSLPLHVNEDIGTSVNGQPQVQAAVNGPVPPPAALGNGPGFGNVPVVGWGQFGPVGIPRAVPNNTSVNALMANEARRTQPRLSPTREIGTLWFGFTNPPRQVIVAAIKRHFDGPWFNMSSVPNETIVQWWGEFVQSFYWDPAITATVYSFWYSVTATRLRGMVSKAKGAVKPDWISQASWDTMWLYWNSPEGRRRSRIAANNRMSDRDGLGPHAHTAGSRSYDQIRENIRLAEGIEPSMLRVLRDTYRRADGSYVDGRVNLIDEAIKRLLAERSGGNNTVEGNEDPTITQMEEDSLYLEVVQANPRGRLFGLGGQQVVRERGESSAMGASSLTVERQVATLQEQFASVIDYLRRYVPPVAEAPNMYNTPQPQGSLGSATSPHHFNAEELAASLAAAEAVINVGTANDPPAQGHVLEDGDDLGDDEDYGDGYDAAYEGF